MSIRKNVLLYIAVSIFLLVAIFTVSVIRILDKSYVELERGFLDRSVKRIAFAIAKQEQDLARIIGDWAPWDDLYRFAQGQNDSFPDDNLSDGTIDNLNLQLILIYDEHGRLVFGTGFDAENNIKTELSEAAIKAFSTTQYGLASFTEPGHAIKNYHLIDGSPYIVCAEPILTSNFQGPPAGVIIFGRRIDDRMAAELSALIQFDVIVELNQHELDQPFIAEHSQTPSQVEEILLDAEYAYLHYPVTDASGEKLARFCIVVPREIAAELNRTNRLLYATMLITGLVIGFGILVLLERSVLRPLDRLVAEVIALGKTRKIDRRINTGKNTGELSRLGDSINQMLGAIEESNAEREYALGRLAEEKEGLAITLKSISDGVITTDVEGRVVIINRVAESLTGWSQEEAFGQPLMDVFRIVHEDTRKPIESPAEKVLSTGQVVELENHVLLISRTGREVAISDSGAPIRNRNSQIIGVVLVFRDVTERRKIDESRIRSNKLESIGVLAGGIAHDFNNILTAIMANLSLARMPETSRDDSCKYMADAEISLDQARSLTKQLLTFSTGGAPVRRLIDLRELLVQVATFTTRGSNVRCRFDIAEDLMATYADAEQINQVISNLVFNAMEAMPDGGEILIAARNATNDLNIPANERNRPYIRVEVKDEGSGIPAAYLNRIFDPYFSTKKRGSGLGLATCYSIIRKHDGYIIAESDANKGARMIFILPATLEKPRPADQALPAIVRGSGRVLIMDDESAILDAATRILSAAGYDVSCARDGEEAVTLYRNAMKDRPYNVVILDLTVPGGMGGMEAFQQIRGLRADVNVIVSSGYSTAPIMAEFHQHGFRGILVKPYGVKELTSAVKQAMNA
ncbi:MAG TPA: CHASE4 domain-containing protein [Kiritimatiellia bacterium]|nr:CHASE4 domain-containing protein [Kiritimatiellia bacterium]